MILLSIGHCKGSAESEASTVFGQIRGRTQAGGG